MGMDKQKEKIYGKPGQKAEKNEKKKVAPEYDAYTQSTLNLLEWQIKFNAEDPFDKDHSAEVATKLQEGAQTNVRKLRTEHLIV
mmetsp:Transcript_27760/g.34500  ORF Transcript_27760/g.34500 Transcript_27760/m.34500 type:complete len:84 (-) Transcript_27760:56-307(-)